jgi:HD-GYP domain-containing protein (c-di-GMP phosphodiesterase class II)
MSTGRQNNPAAWSVEDSVAYLIVPKGPHFDQQCVDAFLNNFEEVQDVKSMFVN